MRDLKTYRSAKTILISLAVLAVGGILFVKLDAGAAAQFADSVLRPLLGDKNVVRSEKVFFNLSDEVQKLENKQPQAPRFSGATPGLRPVTRHDLSLENKQPQAPRFIGATPGLHLVTRHDLSLENKPPQAPRFSGADKDTRIVACHNLSLENIPVSGGFSPLPEEGVWKDKSLSAFPGRTVAACTFVRPDPDRKYAVVTLVKVDTSVMLLGSVAGTKQPGGALGKPGPGRVPEEIRASGRLIAAFDGGFLYRDGEGGMIVGDETYVPLKKDLGALVGYRDGTLRIINYTGQPLGDNVAFVRQNCPLLIADGDVTPLNPKNKSLWGRTMTSSILTWRSGIGLDPNNNLIFAVGNNLTPTTLALALKSAGAINAIQLDINPGWTRFNWFSYRGDGKYTSTTFADWYTDGSQAFLHGSPKDFFYLYEKPQGPRLETTVARGAPVRGPRLATRF